MELGDPSRMTPGTCFSPVEVVLSLACRNRHRQCRQIQASQRARCLARAWQLWVDVHWAEQLSRTLVGGLSSSPSCRGPGSSFSHSSHPSANSRQTCISLWSLD